MPAFAEASGEAIASVMLTAPDGFAGAAAGALAVSADVVHHGHRHLPASWASRADRAVRRLRSIGLVGAVGALAALADVCRYGGAELLDRWADAHLRLLITAEQLRTSVQR